MKILVGADPEVFIKQNNQFLSAYGLIDGDKRNPQRVEKGAVQVDGMALEFNIDPASTSEEFLYNIQTVYSTLRSMVPEYEVIATPVADFTHDYIKAQPEKATELGCDPDYNAWTNRENVKPNALLPIRTASGHVHIGWTDGEDKNSNGHISACNDVVKQLDYFLGLPSLLFDDNTRRRSLYGKAGACRYKHYGVEYRVLSNMWLNSSDLIKWVFDNTQLAIKNLMNGVNLPNLYGNIEQIINTSDVDSAKVLVNKLSIPVPNGC
jgi:hypothetical protein